MEIFVCVYFAVGIILSFYWFDNDYSEEYEEAVKSGVAEKGAAGLLILLFSLLWPIKLIKRWLRNRNSSDG